MTDDIQTILCGSCRVAVEGPADPNAQDVFSCPDCGQSDTYKNVMASVKAFATELAARSLQESLRKSFRGSKSIQLTTKPIPKTTHRFVVDLKL